MLRHGAEGDLEPLGKLAGRAFGMPAQPQNLPAAWLGDDLDRIHGVPSLRRH
jgi:hypothetical protein